VVDGVAETWQLRWVGKTRPVCAANDGFTCPCAGFAYGEGGDLILVRLRKQVEIDRLQITRLFDEPFRGEGRIAIVPRWPEDVKSDLENEGDKNFPALVAKRPVVHLMSVADYDHDGRATEFYLQVSTEPCGKSVGVSRGNSRLHAFGKASNPSKPLRLHREEWEAIRDASGPIEVTDWLCGDHGSESEVTLRLRWGAGGVDGTRHTCTCPPNARRLAKVGPL